MKKIYTKTNIFSLLEARGILKQTGQFFPSYFLPTFFLHIFFIYFYLLLSLSVRLSVYPSLSLPSSLYVSPFSLSSSLVVRLSDLALSSSLLSFSLSTFPSLSLCHSPFLAFSVCMESLFLSLCTSLFSLHFRLSLFPFLSRYASYPLRLSLFFSLSLSISISHFKIFFIFSRKQIINFRKSKTSHS